MSQTTGHKFQFMTEPQPPSPLTTETLDTTFPYHLIKRENENEN